jgi:hypothetical protein
MELEKKIDILKNIFNMDIHNINFIIPKITNINIQPITDILYCYLDKPDIVFKIFNQYSNYELNIISYIIKTNFLTYKQCTELLNLNGLQIRLIFYMINIILLSNTKYTNKIFIIFEIFKNMDDNTLINFYKIKQKVNIYLKINFMQIYYLCRNLNNEQVDSFINSMNNGYSFDDSYMNAVLV